tara:strand:- start:84732 stop:85232 length:501 start_codon:yes stop_codon:yes gene_type:complete
MTLQDIGAIGELVGGIAVIVSLIYLATQVRHGLQGYKSNITQEVTTHFSRLQLDIAKDTDLLRAWLRAERGEDLESLDQRRVLQVVSSFMIGFENLYFQYQAGMVDRDAYEARRPVVANILTYTGARDWWDNYGCIQHPPKFVQEVELVLKEFEGRLSSPVAARLS